MLKKTPVFLSVALLGLLAAYVVFLPPQRVGATYLDSCPLMLAGLPGEELDLRQAVVDDLDPDGILSRVYQGPGGVPVWLIIVYFENARLGAHDPYLCYRSQGFELETLPKEPVDSAIGTIPLQSFRAVRGARTEKVNYFWYTGGQKALAEVKTFRDEMFIQGLLKNRSFGAFVRTSTLEDGNPEETEALLHRFTQELAPLLPTFFPESNS